MQNDTHTKLLMRLSPLPGDKSEYGFHPAKRRSDGTNDNGAIWFTPLLAPL